MVFFLIAFFGMYVGRRLGWALSKNVLYVSPLGIAMIVCIFWGSLVAFLVYSLIQWQHPGLILKAIMGYALGSYVSIPNFGLISEGTIPSNAMPRPTMISWLPLVVYVLSSVGFAFL